MSRPNIRVGDTVRICKKDIFAPFVRKGDLAIVKDMQFDEDCVDLWLDSFGWHHEQVVTISRNRSYPPNKYITFLHDSQKLVDKPSEYP
ncbi:hypothetical protein ACT414_18815 (plasmid) [Acinetobacter baumannii]